MISEERGLLLSAGEAVIDHTSTYEEFEFVLSLGEGIDLKNFDSLSIKTMMQFFEETQGRDVKIKYNPHTRRVERHAQSVQIIINNLRLRLRWIEIGRIHPRGIVWKTQECTIKETRKIGESVLEAAMRELREELKELWERLNYWPRESELTPWGLADEIDIHESSVYSGVLSILTIQRLELTIDYFLGNSPSVGQQTFLVKDTDGKEDTGDKWVMIILKCFSID